MKSYFETWINPKTNLSEEIEVHELFLEDWENGDLIDSVGKHLVHGLSDKFYYYVLSSTEFAKIEVRRKEIYFEKIEKEFLQYVSVFQKRYNQSEAKERLIKTEIDLYEKLLFTERLQIHVLSNVIYPLEEIIMPSVEWPDFSKLLAAAGGFNPNYKGEKVLFYGPRKLNSIEISDIRKLYQKIIVNGEKDFSKTNSPNCRVNIGAGDSNFIRVEGIAKFYEYLKSLDMPFETNSENHFAKTRNLPDTRTEKLKTLLNDFNFFDLNLVKLLQDKQQNELVYLISSKGLPYGIAMFNYLGFLDYLAEEFFPVKYQLYKEISKLFSSDKEGRAVKGNINTLSEISHESKIRYTAHKYKQQVIIDYQNLK